MIDQNPKSRKHISPGMVFVKMIFTFPLFYPVILMYFFTAHVYNATNNKELATKHFQKLEDWSTASIFFSIAITLIFLLSVINAI